MLMINRDKNKEFFYLKKLESDVPEFALLETFDGLIYNDYDRLGSYLLKLIENLDNDKKKILKKIFNHLNSIFNPKELLVLNFLDVCIYEALVSNKLGFVIAKEYMNKKMWEHFLSLYPYEQYKDSWDMSNYYTDEEYQRIMNLLRKEELD